MESLKTGTAAANFDWAEKYLISLLSQPYKTNCMTSGTHLPLRVRVTRLGLVFVY